MNAEIKNQIAAKLEIARDSYNRGKEHGYESEYLFSEIEVYEALLNGELIVGSIEAVIKEHYGSDYVDTYKSRTVEIALKTNGKYTWFNCDENSIKFFSDEQSIETVDQKCGLNKPETLCFVLSEDDREFFEERKNEVLDRIKRNKDKMDNHGKRVRDIEFAVKSQNIRLIYKGRKAPVGAYYCQRTIRGDWGNQMFLIPMTDGVKDMSKMIEYISEDNAAPLIFLLGYLPGFEIGSEMDMILQAIAENPCKLGAWISLCDMILEQGDQQDNILTLAIKAFCGIKEKKSRKTKKI